MQQVFVINLLLFLLLLQEPSVCIRNKFFLFMFDVLRAEKVASFFLFLFRFVIYLHRNDLFTCAVTVSHFTGCRSQLQGQHFGNVGNFHRFMPNVSFAYIANASGTYLQTLVW